MNSKKIGDYISLLRKNKNFTQKELADRLGVTDKAISKWERGAGYPDITLLKPLAEVLDTTVNELLEGEDSKSDPDNPKEEEKEIEIVKEISVNNVLAYADQVTKLKEHNKGKIAAVIIMVSLITAIIVCVIINVAVEHKLSWSYIVTGSCVFGGFIIVPLLLYKKQGFILSLRYLTVLVMPYLGVIQLITYARYPRLWLWDIALPIVLSWLIYIWIIVILLKYKRVKFWLILSVGSLLCIPAQAITNIVASVYDKNRSFNDILNSSIMPTAFICICIAGICIVINFLIQNRNRDL